MNPGNKPLDPGTHESVKKQLEAMHNHLKMGPTAFNWSAVFGSTIKILQFFVQAGILTSQQIQDELVKAKLIPDPNEGQDGGSDGSQDIPSPTFSNDQSVSEDETRSSENLNQNMTVDK